MKILSMTLLIVAFSLFNKDFSLNSSFDKTASIKKPLGYYSGNWPSNSGYHSYGYTSIDASGIPNGGNISINFGAYDVPNRFTILDDCALGTASSSGWQGQASYSGPWGQSINNASSGTLSIQKQQGCNTYRFQVETATSASSGSDSWQVTN